MTTPDPSRYLRSDGNNQGWAMPTARALVASRPEPVPVSAHPGYGRYRRGGVHD